MLHRCFTVTADRLYGAGYMNRDERIALSSAIGDMLADWRNHAMAKLQKAGVENPESVLQKVVMTVLGEAGMPVGPPTDALSAARQAPAWGRMYSKDKEWPFDDKELEPTTSDLGGTMKGLTFDDPEEDHTKDINVSQLDDEEDDDANKNEAVTLPGASASDEGRLAKATKDQENRRDNFGQGERFDMKGDFDKDDEKKEDNYNMDEAKKANLKEFVARREFSKLVVSEVRKNIVEKTPPGKTKAGKPYERVVKAVKKKSPDVNPWAIAWSLKGKQKNESPTLAEFKECGEQFMKDMGFEKAFSRERADIWRRTGK